VFASGDRCPDKEGDGLKSIPWFFLLSSLVWGQVSVTTYHNDNARTGQQLAEVVLTPRNVKAGAFGKRFSHAVDGLILGQPLIVPGVNVAGKGLHDAVILTTGHGTIYAFDADDAVGADAEPLWQTSTIDTASGAAPVTAVQVKCSVIVPELGIVGTPVIDAAGQTVYAVSFSQMNGRNFEFDLHAIDLASGAERAGSPVEIDAPGFVPVEHKQRGALLLSGGTVYVPFGSNCDNKPYHGWLMAYDEKTLKQTAVFNATLNGGEGSFWNGGAGPAADAQGNVYHMSANGDFGASQQNYGDTFVKLKAAPDLQVADYFTPFNQSYLDLNDIDVGSAGPLLLPDDVGNAEHPHLLVGVGKEGRIYLLDRDHLGHAQYNLDSLAIQSLPVLGHSLFGSMAYYDGLLYVATEYSPVRAYRIANASVNAQPSSKSSFTTSALGATPSISANGTADGLVWILAGPEGELQAYDAANLAHMLYSSSTLSGDAPGSWVEFTVPTIADGKVYVGTQDQLVVYGLLNSAPGQVRAVVNGASFAPGAVSPGSIMSLFGTGLAPPGVQAGAAGTPLPVSLGDVEVKVNGEPAGLEYVSADQINALLPPDVPSGSAQIAVTVSGTALGPLDVTVAAAAPGIFSTSSGDAAALNDDDDSALVTPATPAKPGETVSLFLTGLDAEDALLPVTATVGGLPASIQYAGPAPGYVGVEQVNLLLPVLAAGRYPVVVYVGGEASNTAWLSMAGN
jgi:uncharacterized protein (TIGR03437 family)